MPTPRKTKARKTGGGKGKASKAKATKAKAKAKAKATKAKATKDAEPIASVGTLRMLFGALKGDPEWEARRNRRGRQGAWQYVTRVLGILTHVSLNSNKRGSILQRALLADAKRALPWARNLARDWASLPTESDRLKVRDLEKVGTRMLERSTAGDDDATACIVATSYVLSTPDTLPDWLLDTPIPERALGPNGVAFFRSAKRKRSAKKKTTAKRS
jgi:hypothetical protein